MLYQQILKDERPYHLILGENITFGEHKHADIEFCYCLGDDPMIISVDKSTIEIKDGELLLLGPGIPHEYIATPDGNSRIFSGIVGVSFLKKYFHTFSKFAGSYTVINLLKSKDDQKALDVIHEMIELHSERSEYAELLKTADLYKLCAYLIAKLSALEPSRKTTRSLETLANVERALDLIYYDYKQTLSVESVASATGYGVSNFCKLFKRATGVSFHTALNQRRISVALGFLSETNMSILQIAEEVGFSASKSFCRVFRDLKGMTPTEYRESHKLKSK